MEATAQLLGRFVTYIINPAILIVFAAGFFMFVWGLIQFILDLQNGGKHEEGIEHMKWGIVGMVIMVSVYGIIAIIDNTFRLGALQGNQPDMSRLENLNLPTNLFTNQ